MIHMRSGDGPRSGRGGRVVRAPGGGGRGRRRGASLLLRAAGAGCGGGGAPVVLLVCGKRHLPEGRGAQGGGEACARRSDPGRDRRALPRSAVAAGQAERAGAGGRDGARGRRGARASSPRLSMPWWRRTPPGPSNGERPSAWAAFRSARTSWPTRICWRRSCARRGSRAMTWCWRSGADRAS